MADVIDNDTMEAIVRKWKASTELAALLPRPIESGRLHAEQDGKPLPMPYARLDVEFSGRSLMGVEGPWLDVRIATITVYGSKDQAAKILAELGKLFNRKTELVYPSGARFWKWWPLDGGRLEEDDTTREGKDVWRAVVQAEVQSFRTDGV